LAPDDATCCLPKPALADRCLLSKGSAAELAGLFKVLASDTRLRLLHALVRDGELCVSELCRQIVESRRDGLQVFYRITDPCVPELLDRGLCLLEDAKERRG
jgi:DNA-binding transcriptional ArsR family regulator